MPVGLITITHRRIGEELVHAACSIFGDAPLATRHITFDPSGRIEDLERAVSDAAEGLDSGDGTIILTDLYGATPSNVACSLAQSRRVRVLSGINLPMVLRVSNYARLDLAELVERARQGARAGIVECGAPPPDG